MSIPIMSKVLIFLKTLVYADGVKPLPANILIVTFLLMVFNAMATTLVFSFLPKMVKSFGASELDAGYYAGMIASSIYVGRMIFSILWGYLADTKGRKFSAILAGSGLALTTLAFGFSMNFYFATITRFLQGCCMGMVIITKAILADVCDDSNMSIGMSVIMTSFSVGLILGPSIGGFLVFPSEQYPKTFSPGNIFGKFGILLPAFIVALSLALSVIIAIIYLPNDKKKLPVAEQASLISHDSGGQTTSYGSIDNIGIKERRVDDHENVSLNVTISRINKVDDDTKMASSYSSLSLVKRFKETKMYQVLQVKECMFSGLLYAWISVVDVGFGEIFPLFAATNAHYKGLGFTTSEIGTVLMIVSIALIILQMTIVPKITNYLGSKKTLVISNLALTFLYPMLPVVVIIENKIGLWICLVILITLIRCMLFTAILAVNIFINNSVVPDLLGSANGIAMTFASIGRMISPIFAGSVYSWSLGNIGGSGSKLGFPFDQFFIFYLFSIFSILLAVFSMKLPDSMNYKKVTSCEPSTSRMNNERN